MSKKKLSSGDRVRTNARYARIVGNKTPHEGVLVREVGWLSGCWNVSMEGFDKVQRVHESMMEVCDAAKGLDKH